MRLTLIIYSFILGIINHNILSKIPIIFIDNKFENITFIILLELIIFIILEIILYRKTTLKESLIASLIRFSSWLLGYLVDYILLLPNLEIFNNTTYSVIHMFIIKIIFFLISTSSLIGIIISANKEDKWNDYKEYIKKEKKPSS